MGVGGGEDGVVVVVGLVTFSQVCDVLGGYRVLISREFVTEIAKILLSGDIAGQRGGKVSDVGFTAGGEAVLVELNVFGYDAFAKSRDPQKKTAVLLAFTGGRADVDGRLSTGNGLVLDCLGVAQQRACGAEDLKVFVWRLLARPYNFERGFSIEGPAGGAGASRYIEAEAIAAEAFAHVAEIEVMTKGTHEGPAAPVFSKAILMLGFNDREALVNEEIKQQLLELAVNVFFGIVRVEEFDFLRQALLVEGPDDSFKIQALLPCAGARYREGADREGMLIHIDQKLLQRDFNVVFVLEKINPFHATGSIDKVQHDVTGNEEKVEMNLPQDSRVAGRNRRCILAPCSGALAAFAWR